MATPDLNRVYINMLLARWPACRACPNKQLAHGMRAAGYGPSSADCPQGTSLTELVNVPALTPEVRGSGGE